MEEQKTPALYELLAQQMKSLETQNQTLAKQMDLVVQMMVAAEHRTNVLERVIDLWHKQQNLGLSQENLIELQKSSLEMIKEKFPNLKFGDGPTSPDSVEQPELSVDQPV